MRGKIPMQESGHPWYFCRYFGKMIHLAMLGMLLLVIGCSSGKTIQGLQSKDRAKISNIRLSVTHDTTPSVHTPLVSYASRAGRPTTYSIVGYSGWTKKQYNAVSHANEHRVRALVKTFFPPSNPLDAMVGWMLADLSESHDAISIAWPKGSEKTLAAGGQKISENGTAMTIRVYHKTMPYKMYAGYHAKMVSATGAKIYDRIQFSREWGIYVPDQYYGAEIRAFIEKATREVWDDIRR